MRRAPVMQIVTTSKILTNETGEKPDIQPIPTTEKRRRPGPKGRNGVAFNDEWCN